MNIRLLNPIQMLCKYFCHRRTRHIGPLLRQATVSKIATRMLRVGQIHIRDDIHNPPVSLFRQTLILAAVPRLHMEDGNMQPLCPDHGQAGVCVSQYQHRIRHQLRHYLVTCRNDIPHRLAEIRSDCIQIQLRILQPQIPEEHTVQVIIIVLPGMDQDGVKILPALLDHAGKPYNLRPRPHDDHQLDLSIFLP